MLFFVIIYNFICESMVQWPQHQLAMTCKVIGLNFGTAQKTLLHITLPLIELLYRAPAGSTSLRVLSTHVRIIFFREGVVVH